MLATLILEDYLKLRGSLLIYILASTLDPLREIRELATELVLKYTLEKNEGFMRNCLLECPFVFNGCPCFGQSTVARTHSENILRGAGKKASRELIYRHLIRKIDAAHLYNYFGNMARLCEHIEKSRTLRKSIDEKAAIVDFIFVCTEVCTANAKHKRAIDKIIRDTQNGEKSALPVDVDQEMADAEAAAAAEAGVGTSTKTPRGRKNQPTLAQALLIVERVIPHIVQIVEMLIRIDADMFETILEKMCVEMCAHFEAMFEYAQPREFWAKYIELAAKVAAPPPKRTQNRVGSVSANKETSANDQIGHNGGPSTATAATVTESSAKTKASDVEHIEADKNDSGQFTMENENEVRSVASERTVNRTPASSRRSRAEKQPKATPSRSTRGNTSSGNRRSKSNRRNVSSEDDSDNESIVSSVSAKSSVSYASQRSTSSKVTTPQFVRKRRKY